MGYSVHFATAVAIVARLCNIPSRYVTGFLVNFPGKNDESFVTGFSAHSWVEIWSKQNGWQTIEPTEAVIPTNYKFEKGIWTYKYKVASNILTNLQINSVLKQQINLRVREIKPIIINPFYIYLIISILLLLIFIWVFYNRVRFLFLKDKKALSWVSAKILRRISFHKIENPSKIGWLLWQKKVQEKFPQLKIVINSFVTTIIETGFGPRQLTKKDVTNVAKYFYMIKKQIKKKAIE